MSRSNNTCISPFPKGTAVEVDGRKVPHYLASGADTMPFSLTGHPVVVIPIGQTQIGLPMGMQIVGKRWKEMELLAIAQQLTEITGGFPCPSGYSRSRQNLAPISDRKALIESLIAISC